jgi:hypothetical protein
MDQRWQWVDGQGLKNVDSGKCLALTEITLATNNRDVQMTTCGSGTGQDWKLSSGKLKNARAGECLDRDDAAVDLEPCNAASTWTVTKALRFPF